MKTLSTCSAFLVLSGLISFGQIPRATLGTDSTFLKALREIKYPDSQSLAQKTTVVFVQFKIDKQGKLTQIKYPNESKVSNLFISEVGRVMWYLPPQRPTYVGEYILPILFGKERTQEENRHSSAQEVVTAYTQLFKQTSRSVRPLLVLNEIYVPAHP